jgi:hypothetical protein
MCTSGPITLAGSAAVSLANLTISGAYVLGTISQLSLESCLVNASTTISGPATNTISVLGTGLNVATAIILTLSGGTLQATGPISGAGSALLCVLLRCRVCCALISVCLLSGTVALNGVTVGAGAVFTAALTGPASGITTTLTGPLTFTTAMTGWVGTLSLVGSGSVRLFSASLAGAAARLICNTDDVMVSGAMSAATGSVLTMVNVNVESEYVSEHMHSDSYFCGLVVEPAVSLCVCVLIWRVM